MQVLQRPRFGGGGRAEAGAAPLTGGSHAARVYWRAPAATALVVVGVTVFVLLQLHPSLLLLNTEDSGGDNAAHITAPYFLIHHLLSHGQVTGWDPWWFDGFPLYTFYFPLPALLVAVLSLVSPYAVAFKLVTALGSLSLPGCSYAFGRLAGLRRPSPALMAAAAVPFLFNTSYSIDGGNVYSTMAGEFSFSLALSFALLFLGFFARLLRTGRGASAAAALYLCTVLSHVVPALFCAGAALLMALTHLSRRSLRRLVAVGAVGALLSAFWLLPFAAYVGRYSSSMNYGPVPGSFFSNVLPQTGELAIACLALVGWMIAIWRAERVLVAAGLSAVASAALFQWMRVGLVYNGRWLPFWFLSIGLLAAHAVAETGRMAWSLLRAQRANEWATALLGGSVAVVLVAAWLGVLPSALDVAPSHRNGSSSWAAANYTGYQRHPGWPELQRVAQMLEAVARRHGCGRLDYEYTSGVGGETGNRFGSTLFEMSLPLWTRGCIDTTEGIYFESSTTTHFHFLDQSELSNYASNPVAGLAYENTSVTDGVKHLQLQGVRYFLANSPSIEAQADGDPALVRLASTPATPDSVDVTAAPRRAEWVVYLIRHSALVRPLDHLPAIESGLDVTAIAPLTDPVAVAMLWYQQKQYWQVPIAAAGPTSWPRFALGTLVAPKQSPRVVPTRVSHVVVGAGQSSVAFDVSRLGSPVEVAIPYFPNWQASGALGPYLVTPNLMVVVPTSHHVLLHYGTSGIDWAGRGLSLAGVMGLGVIALRPARLEAGRGAPVGPAPIAPGSGPRSPAAEDSLEGGGRRDDEDDEGDEGTGV